MTPVTTTRLFMTNFEAWVREFNQELAERYRKRRVEACGRVGHIWGAKSLRVNRNPHMESKYVTSCTRCGVTMGEEV